MKHNLQQECPAKRLQTKAARKWLRALELGAIDRVEMDVLLARWEIEDTHIEEVEKQILQRQRQNDVAAIIATVPGMQAHSSLAVASRIGNIENFLRPGSLANYWGLTPGCRNSGDATARLGSITKQGSAIVRFILGQVILHVLRRDRAMKAWYLRIKKRRGAKIAKVAAMRRPSRQRPCRRLRRRPRRSPRSSGRFSKAWQDKRMSTQRSHKNSPGRRNGRSPTGHSPVLTRLSLVGLLLSRARLCSTEQLPR
jgi:transposase